MVTCHLPEGGWPFLLPPRGLPRFYTIIRTQLEHPIRLNTYDSLSKKQEEVLRDFIDFVSAVITQLKPFRTFQKLDVKILARKNTTITDRYNGPALQKIRSRLQRELGLPVELEVHTFHRAKGLEADFTLLLDDAAPSPAYPFRDFLYRCIKNPITYTQAQTEEAFRLGYVALTRARFGAMWAVDKEEVQSEGSFAVLDQQVVKR